MNLKHRYWFFKSALPYKFCDDLKKYASERQSSLGVIGGVLHKIKPGQELKKKDLDMVKKKRKSNVVFVGEKWIYDQVYPYLDLANKNAGWNFNIDWAEDCQFTVYKKGQFYGWHRDTLDEPYNNPAHLNHLGKIRKLSMTVSLSDPEEYEGGRLQFCYREDSEPGSEPRYVECTEILPKGSVVVFPSNTWHRITPVTKGTRHSLVLWSLGHPFR